MRLTPLDPLDPAALAEALERRGTSPPRAEAAAQGSRPLLFVVDELDANQVDALARASQTVSTDCWTGPTWAVLGGTPARLAGLTRPGFEVLPPELQHLIGQYLHSAVRYPEDWRTAAGSVGISRPLVVGILNITPDSFSDGGEFLSPERALARAEAMLEEGADLLDLGGESTRPGRPDPVSVEEEWSRLEPVITGLVKRFPELPLSVDTVKSEIARRAVSEGVAVINDVSGLRLDPGIAEVCRTSGAGLILMHSRGGVTDMASYDHAEYHDVSTDIIAELRVALDLALERGVSPEQIVLDVGLGFAKTPAQTWAAFRSLRAVRELGRPVMIGPSRKRFLGEITGRPVDERDPATAAACVAGFERGARLFRVHNVAIAREALDVAFAVEDAGCH